MPFIRAKRTSAGITYQVVKSVREDGKIRQEVLVSLSRSSTITEAIACVEALVAESEERVAQAETRQRHPQPPLQTFDRESRYKRAMRTLDSRQRRLFRLRRVQAETGLP